MKAIFSNKLPTLLLVYICLLGLSFSLEPNNQFVLFRFIRVLVSLVWIPFFVLNWLPKNNGVLGFCLFYAISSAFAIGFESNVVGILSMCTNGISFMFLIRLIYRRIEFKPMSWVFLISLLAVIVINIWLLYLFLDVIDDFLQGYSLLIAICFSTFFSFTLSVLAFIYNNEDNSKSSLLFIFFIIFLVFSETFRGAGYYSFIDPVYGQYSARFLLIISFLLLYKFTSVRIEKDRL